MTIDPDLLPAPPMGFNTWNRFGVHINERLIEETMEALVGSGLAELGYTYLNLDDGWMAPERDRRGRLVPDPVRFPGGIARLAERAHAVGLRLGIYSDSGHKTCQGLPASYGHEREDAETFAGWGVDYLKYDWCHVPFEDFPGRSHRYVAETLYGRMSDALSATGHPIVFSMCNWGDGEPWLWARGVAHLWRTTRDILDAYRKPDSRWSLDMLTIFRENVVLADHAAPGGFNDPDMLEIGNGHMTATEYRTHMSLWCLMAAPLLIGCDLRTMSAETRAILGQRDLIAIDQDALGRQARLARREGELYTLVKPLQDGGAAVGLFNAGDVAMEVRLSWSELLGDGPRRAREIWADADARERMVQGQESLTVAAHATRVWRVAPQGAAMR